MPPVVYYIIHVLSALLLVGFTFQAFANPDPEMRRGMLLRTGVLAVLMAVAGFGLQAKLQTGMPVWLIIKIVCWFGLSAMAGLAYRRPGSGRVLTLVTTLLLAVAVYMAYGKPGL